MVGYQLHRCDLDRIAKEPRFARLMCPSCRLLAREPMTTPCDHVFCSSCLKDIYQNEVVVCPVDGKQFRRLEVFPDNFVRREVLALVVHCTFLDDGCNWKGEVGGLEMHLKECHGHGCASEKSAHSETCERCNQLQRQITQLKRQLLKVEIEKDEAIKLKEEILDVNHEWDAQYKMLEAASNKEISELKQQIEVLSSAGSQIRNGPFQLESARMKKRPLTSQGLPPGVAALSKGAHTVTSPQDSPSWPGINPRDQQIPPEAIDEIEVLKQQLRVYADDFAAEKEERERLRSAQEKMREEINAMNDRLEQQFEAQRICVESYHDECVTERARAFDDEEMQVSLIQNHMENQQNSLADLRNSHAVLQNSLACLQDRVRRLEADPNN